MSLAYLPEHAENALLAQDLAKKEAAHLAYTHRTLFAQPIDLNWVRNLAQRDDPRGKDRRLRQPLRPVAGSHR